MKNVILKFTSVWLIYLCVLAAPAVAQEHDDGDQPIDCHGEKIVLFPDAVSDDGYYAAGWTIPADKGAPPVDWSRRKEMGDVDFVDAYIEDKSGKYGFDNCFIDLKRKRAIRLPSDRPTFVRENHGEILLYSTPGARTPGYCLVENESRFATDNLFLVRIDPQGLSQMDLRPALEKAVRPILAEKRPLYSKIMAVSWPNSEWDDNFMPPVFHATTVDIQFNADLPKAGYDKVTGWATVSLPEGKVLKIVCDVKRGDPFHDDPALARADRELNEVYAVLQKQLPPGKQAALKKEQLAWIAARELDTESSYPMAGDDITVPAFTADRNKDLVKTTRERTATLRAMAGK